MPRKFGKCSQSRFCCWTSSSSSFRFQRHPHFRSYLGDHSMAEPCSCQRQWKMYWWEEGWKPPRGTPFARQKWFAEKRSKFTERLSPADWLMFLRFHWWWPRLQSGWWILRCWRMCLQCRRGFQCSWGSNQNGLTRRKRDNAIRAQTVSSVHDYHEAWETGCVQTHGWAECHNGEGSIAAHKWERHHTKGWAIVAHSAEKLTRIQLWDFPGGDEFVRQPASGDGHAEIADVRQSWQKAILKYLNFKVLIKLLRYVQAQS